METEEWNKSTLVNKPVVERKTMQHYINDRSNRFSYNYRAESLESLTSPETNLKRTEEMPVNMKLQDVTPWNKQTTFDRKEMARLHTTQTQKSLEWTKSGKHRTALSAPTLKPILIKPKTAQNQDASSTNESISYSTFSQMSLLSRPFINRYKNEKSRAWLKEEHSGVWSFNPQEGVFMWSDTGSTDFNSKGDILRVVDPDKYTYAGPTLKTSVTTCKKKQRPRPK